MHEFRVFPHPVGIIDFFCKQVDYVSLRIFNYVFFVLWLKDKQTISHSYTKYGLAMKKQRYINV